MRLLRARIFRNRTGTDTVSIETDLPSGTYPFTDRQYVSLQLAKGTAETYLKEHLPEVPIVEVIEIKS